MVPKRAATRSSHSYVFSYLVSFIISNRIEGIKMDKRKRIKEIGNILKKLNQFEKKEKKECKITFF